MRGRERVRGPCVHHVLHSDALGLRQAQGDPRGHDENSAGKDEEHSIFHGAHHLIEALPDDEAGNEVDKDNSTHAGRAGLVCVDLQHLRACIGSISHQLIQRTAHHDRASICIITTLQATLCMSKKVPCKVDPSMAMTWAMIHCRKLRVTND